MVAKDVKAMLQDEGGDEEVGSEEGGRSGDEDDSLFKLVRNASKRVNVIVTLAGSNQDYVLSRWSSLMVTDQEGGDKFVPQRPRQSGDSKTSVSEKRERSVSSEDLVVDKGEELPAEEAIAVTLAEGAKPRQKRKKSKRSKAGKSEVGAFQEVWTSASSDWGKSNPPTHDWGKSTSSTCDSAGVTPVHNPGVPGLATDRPTWRTMLDYSDDKRFNKEWGLWGKDPVRKSRDDKMRGRSPPPREKKGASDRMCEGGPWGEANARSEPGWGSPKRGSPDRPRLSVGSPPSPEKQESSSKSPEESPKLRRPWNRTRRTVRMSSSSSDTLPPNLSSETEENTFLVRVKKGETKAKVLFLNDQKSQGWEGPFDLSLTMEEMVDFNARPAPRAHTWPASVKESDSSSGEEESGGSETSEKVKDPLYEKGLDQHLEGDRGVGYRELMASARKAGTGYRDLMSKEVMTQAEWEAIYWEQREEWNSLDPRFKVRDVVWWYHKPLGVGKWSRAIVEKVILPTELQYREGWTDIVYQIMQTPMGDEHYGSSIAREVDMRPGLWGDPTK